MTDSSEQRSVMVERRHRFEAMRLLVLFGDEQCAEDHYMCEQGQIDEWVNDGVDAVRLFAAESQLARSLATAEAAGAAAERAKVAEIERRCSEADRADQLAGLEPHGSTMYHRGRGSMAREVLSVIDALLKT